MTNGNCSQQSLSSMMGKIRYHKSYNNIQHITIPSASIPLPEKMSFVVVYELLKKIKNMSEHKPTKPDISTTSSSSIIVYPGTRQMASYVRAPDTFITQSNPLPSMALHLPPPNTSLSLYNSLTAGGQGPASNIYRFQMPLAVFT